MSVKERHFPDNLKLRQALRFRRASTFLTLYAFYASLRSETSRKRVKSPLVISMRISRFRSNLIDMIAIVKLRNSVNFQSVSRNEHFSVARL